MLSRGLHDCNCMRLAISIGLSLIPFAVLTPNLIVLLNCAYINVPGHPRSTYTHAHTWTQSYLIHGIDAVYSAALCKCAITCTHLYI